MKKTFLLTIFTLLLYGCASSVLSTPRYSYYTYDGKNTPLKNDGTSRGFVYLISRENTSECIILKYVGKSKEVIIPEKIAGRNVIEIRGFSGPGTTNIRSVIIPNGVRIIGDNAFSTNLLSEITIPNSVEIIGKRAFHHNRLNNIIIPNSVISIGNEAFSENRLTNVIIPDSVITIGEKAFNSNPIINITVGSNVTTIGRYAFGGFPRDSEQIANLYIKNKIEILNYSIFGNIDLTGAYIQNDRQNGNYTRQGNIWLFNGSVIIPKFAEIRTGIYIQLVSIDGISPSQFQNQSHNFPREYYEKIYSKFPFPSRIIEFCSGRFYLPPGIHSIEVVYLEERSDTNSINFSTDSMIWEQRYLFEGYTYEINYKRLPENRLQFSIDRI